ncbi:NIF family HAD-type phosphatase [Aliarcobacter butzleri]|uniref:NIF family HAD-type phosphatase n=1 Tax=Aliarcobacter butzleri TaxID=28197 RepID=UPI003AF8D122
MIKMAIFDLDDTLVDTSSFKEKRDNGEWDKLSLYINNFTIIGNAINAINKLIEKNVIIVIMTTSIRDYASKIILHFSIPCDHLYAYENLIQSSDTYTSLKTNSICSLKSYYHLQTNEVIFIGDSYRDYKACEETNTMFITHPNSQAHSDFGGKLISVNSYDELIEAYDYLKDNSSHLVHQREHENFGNFTTFSNYLTDIYPIIPHQQNRKVSYDSMHKRVLDLKDRKIKSLINWLQLLHNMPLRTYFPNIQFVTRALGSSEIFIDKNNIEALDIITFCIAHNIGAEYKTDLLYKSSIHDKLSHSGQGFDGRKEIIDGKYTFSNNQIGNILVFDDIITTGATFSEIKRAITSVNTGINLQFCSIAQSLPYERKKYVENINNSNYFHCANESIETVKLYYAYLIYYILKLSPEEQKKITFSDDYLSGVVNIKDKVIFGARYNFMYFRVKMNSNGQIIIGHTICNLFNNLNECKSYSNPRTPQFIKEIIESLYNQLN